MAGAVAETATAEEKEAHGKLLKKLARYNSPADVAKALRAAEVRISSGELKPTLPKNATEDQVKAWRVENGIPETPDKYDLGLPKEEALNDLDNEMLKDWADRAHKANASPEVVKAGAASYMAMRAKVRDQMLTKDAAQAKETQTELREEWGRDYDDNIDGANSYLKSHDSEVVRNLMDARTADGIRLGNMPGVVAMFAKIARAEGYVGATVVPTGGDLGKTIDAELDELRKQMGTDEWAKNDKGQKRFMELTEAKKRAAARAK